MATSTPSKVKSAKAINRLKFEVIFRYMAGCRGVIQLGDLAQCSSRLRLRLGSLFYSLKFPCVENQEYLVDLSIKS